MMQGGKKLPARWAIVLAGGEGERLRPFIREQLGYDRPKQYCKLTSDRTLLEETLLRTRTLVPKEQVVTIIDRSHRRFVNGEAKLCKRFIEQPVKRETAPGIFLPAAHVLRADPSATVLILPSDHYIEPQETFLQWLDKAAILAGRRSDRIIVLGATPTQAEPDYGWIEPDRLCSPELGGMEVLRFIEKPDAEKAAELFARGCLWNTMIMAVKIRTLWEIGRACLPSMIRRFEELIPALGTSREAKALMSTYRDMDTHNFSREVLERVPDSVMVLPMTGIDWSDLGRPARINQTLERLGRTAVA